LAEIPFAGHVSDNSTPHIVEFTVWNRLNNVA